MKRLWILLCTLAALTVAVIAAAYCPTPTGSAGGNGWNGGATQSYIKDVSIGVDRSMWVVNWCDIGTTNCREGYIQFAGKAFFTYRGGAWHGSQAFPLRFMSFTKYLCSGASGTQWCVTFAGDYDAGDHINPLQNATVWSIDEGYAYPSNTTDPTYIQAPLGHQIVKIAGMGASPAQTLRINYVNASDTAIATKDVFFGPMGCP